MARIRPQHSSMAASTFWCSLSFVSLLFLATCCHRQRASPHNLEGTHMNHDVIWAVATVIMFCVGAATLAWMSKSVISAYTAGPRGRDELRKIELEERRTAARIAAGTAEATIALENARLRTEEAAITIQ